jgi:Domain of unknown function (DUF4407)/Protein kinase domain
VRIRPQRGPLARFGDFLVFLTGANRRLMTHGERHWFITIGVLMVLTAGQAFYAGTTILSISFNQRFEKGVWFGAFFGAFVFFIDRTIVSQVAPAPEPDPANPKTDFADTKRSPWGLIVRLVIALCASILMGEAIAIQVFAQRIGVQLAADQIRNEHSLANAINGNYAKYKIGPLQAGIDQAQKAASQKEQAYRDAVDALHCELYGGTRSNGKPCGHIVVGPGPVASADQKAVTAANDAMTKAQETAASITDKNRPKILQYQEDQKKELAQAGATSKDTDLLAREEAFWKITTRSPTIAFWRGVLALLLLGIDLMPMLAKLTSRVRAYEDSVRAEQIKAREKARVDVERARIQHGTERATAQAENAKRLVELESDKAVHRAQFEGQRDLDIGRWKRHFADAAKRDWQPAASPELGLPSRRRRDDTPAPGWTPYRMAMWDYIKPPPRRPPRPTPAPSPPPPASGGGDRPGSPQPGPADQVAVFAMPSSRPTPPRPAPRLPPNIPEPPNPPEPQPRPYPPSPPTEPSPSPPIEPSPPTTPEPASEVGSTITPEDLLGQMKTVQGMILRGQRRWRLYRATEEGGGGGTIWHAVDLDDRTQRRYVVKTVPSELGNMDMDHMLKRGSHQKEVRMTVSHPHIAEIVDSGKDSDLGLYFTVSPRYEPGSLEWCFRRPGTQRPLLWCAAWILQVLDALDAASRARFVHLDIKPGNLVLDGGNIRIIDWGLSRRWNDPDPKYTHVARGTPFYASPEQIERPHPGWDTPLADLYSLGAVFYWLITDEAPLKRTVKITRRDDPLTVVKEHIRKGVRPVPVDQLVSGVPSQLGMLIDRWLSYQPDQRVRPGTAIKDSLLGARADLTALMPLLPAIFVGRTGQPGRGGRR